MIADCLSLIQRTGGDTLLSIWRPGETTGNGLLDLCILCDLALVSYQPKKRGAFAWSHLSGASPFIVGTG